MKSLAALLFVFLSLHSVQASCGLAGCPTPLLGFDKPWISGLEIRTARFNLEGHSGHYIQNDLRMEYRGSKRFITGAHLPLMTLWESGGGHRTGLGNAVGFAEGSLLKRERWSLAGGLQVELPTGDAKAGLSGDHAGLLGYLSAAGTGHGLLPFGTVGFRAAFAEEHAHDAAAMAGEAHEDHDLVLINPHGDRELVYRLGYRVHFPGPALMAEAYVDGQCVMDEKAGERNFFALGFSAEMATAGRFTVRPLIEIPLGPARRFEWAAGLRLSAGF